MDEQLRRLRAEYEDSLPVSFTEEDKRKVVEKIINGKHKKTGRHFSCIPRIAAGALLMLIVLLIVSPKLYDLGSHSTSSVTDPAAGQGQIAAELTIGGKINEKEYPSNYHLYIAHFLSTSIASESGTALGKEEKLSVLGQLKKELDQIETKREKKAEFRHLQQLAGQALEEKSVTGKTIEDIHKSLHELDEYFNKQRFMDDHSNSQMKQR